MVSASNCTICGEPSASLCGRCNAAAYCSIECQQVDYRPHKLLCAAFKTQSESNFAARPSPNHYLAISFPMIKKKPSLVWVECKDRAHTNPDLEPFFQIAGNDRVAKNVHFVLGNDLRGRETNPNMMHIWYVDDGHVNNMKVNNCLHGTAPTLIGDTWGETMWEGPMLVLMVAGNTGGNERLMDVNLTGYRDAIDFLGYYREGIGSMVHGAGSGSRFAKEIMSQRSGKVKGIRINCVRDQALRREPDMVPVFVPKTHPLFNLEGDDPFAVPYALEWHWVAKLYGNSKKTNAGEIVPSGAFANPLARLLLTPITKFSGDDDYRGVEEQDFDRWEPIWKGWKDPDIGSVLVVDREPQDLEIDKVRAMCKFIEQKVAPLLTEERACDPDGREEVQEAITMRKFKRFLRG